MNLLAKFRETAVSVLPVTGIVLVLGCTAAPLGWMALGQFALGGVLLVLGLTLFLLGVDIGIQPMGERCGAALTRRRSLPLLLGATFLIGFIVTAAEPDIQVFGDQVKGSFPSVSKGVFTFAIAGGVGAFMLVGLLRILTRFSIKTALAVSYGLLFCLALFAPDGFLGIAFDSGGATTGPMTVPFIMALGLGVAAVRNDEGASFGLTGLASVGPVCAVLLYSLVLRQGAAVPAEATEAVAESGAFLEPLREAIPHALGETLLSIAPLYALFLLFRFTLLPMTGRQFVRLTTGFVYAFLGLFVFLSGVHGGFMQAGAELGVKLGAAAAQGPGHFALLLATGLALGAIIVCAEPAVWVLSEQVEEVSGGAIRRRTLLVFLSLGTALAIGLAMWRAVAGFPLAWLLVPGYLAAMALMAFTPPLFCGIAFDSGGVASGPLTSTFILSFTLGAASGGAGGKDTFGVIALVAMMPLLAIQTMGILYARARKRGQTP